MDFLPFDGFAAAFGLIARTDPPRQSPYCGSPDIDKFTGSRGIVPRLSVAIIADRLLTAGADRLRHRLGLSP
jgi:hypothetical protein